LEELRLFIGYGDMFASSIQWCVIQNDGL